MQTYYLPEFIPAAIKLFAAKGGAQLLYRVQLGPYNSMINLERIQTTFLKRIFQVTHCVSKVVLRQEAGVSKLEFNLWINIFAYWLKLHYDSNGLPHLILEDNYKSSWEVGSKRN